MNHEKSTVIEALDRQEMSREDIEPPHCPALKTAEEPESATVVAHARGESYRAFPALSTLITNLAGTAIVLACIILQLVLGELAVSTEEAAKDGYIQALHATANASSLAAPVAQTQTCPQLFDQHYYFVNGCVAAPRDCANTNAGSWGEYYVELRRLYEEAVQTATREQTQSFEEWAREHAYFINSQNAPAGVSNIAHTLQENRASSNIHMVGTSAGGAAIFSYLSQAMRGEVPLDRRIRSVMAIDSPLGYQPPFAPDDIVNGLMNGLQASSMKSDVELGLGEWAKAANILILTVDTREDVVGYDPLPDVANDPNPTYPQSDSPPAPAYLNCSSLPCQLGHLAEFLDLGSIWHIYTGSHMANSARQFIDEHWR